jgi:hypothetical protein
MRAFRDFLKDKFMKVYGTKYYYWIPATLREKTKEFWTNPRLARFGID